MTHVKLGLLGDSWPSYICIAYVQQATAYNRKSIQTANYSRRYVCFGLNGVYYVKVQRVLLKVVYKKDLKKKTHTEIKHKIKVSFNEIHIIKVTDRQSEMDKLLPQLFNLSLPQHDTAGNRCPTTMGHPSSNATKELPNLSHVGSGF